MPQEILIGFLSGTLGIFLGKRMEKLLKQLLEEFLEELLKICPKKHFYNYFLRAENFPKELLTEFPMELLG